MPTPPARRPGGRSERVRLAVLAAADELVEQGCDLTVAMLGARAGVSEVTVYRRWGTADNVLLDAAVHQLGKQLPVTPTGDLRHDLTTWARGAERSLNTPIGRRLLIALARVRHGENPTAGAAIVGSYMQQRGAQLQQLLDAADPPTTIGVSEVLDRVLAPIYLRYLFGYQPATPSVEDLVRDLLSDPSSACTSEQRQRGDRDAEDRSGR